jgi:uncharacterized protein YecE (DUF72 family)
MIYVGTCGYAYKDWIGPFYPPRTRTDEMLRFYARQFRAVEIDMSYYGIPAATTIASMNRLTPENFRFSFKAPQTVTHARDAGSGVHADALLLRETIEPLRAAGKLACVLAQFANRFKPDAESEAYLQRVVEAFEGVPVVAEFRHRDWQRPRTIELLRDLGAGYANVDIPALESLPHASADVTSRIGYVRMHGRNAAQWWTGTNVTRYAYAYTPQELEPWADRIAEIESQAQETYVFFNNHANGRAARNAEMIEALLDDRYGEEAQNIIAHAEGGNPEQGLLPGIAPPYEDQG